MHQQSAKALSHFFKSGEVSASSIAEKTLTRIAKHDAQLDAFLSILTDRVLLKAQELDRKRASNKPLGKLAGVPIVVKDNMHIKGEITTCASRFLSNYRAVFDATVVRLLEEEDALIIGKTNLDEFAMGSSTENSAFKTTKNPWDLSCSPGGSSGGSAASVAARLCPIALGSDTGGSIRQPAALCGILGFKPTYGRVSRYGLVAFASSLDQIGPFTTNVEDMALIMEVIGRHCEHDSTSLNLPVETYSEKLNKSLQNIKIGVPWHFLENLSEESKENFLRSIDTLKKTGATIVDIDLDILKYSIAIYYILATAEASTNLARFDGIRYGLRSKRATTLDEVYDFSKQEGFGPEVKNRILLGTYVLSSGFQDAYYKKAQKVRTLIIQQVKKAFSDCSIIAMPTSPFPAFPLGSLQDPLQMYLQDIYTICANLTGLPAINIPSGFSKDNKPFGLQLLGPQMHDAHVLSCAYAFEQATNFNQKIPPLFDDKGIV
ncbi:MAG TPA: Asp-tRNA(Asn)/Glu-tRNA(Gln) amidotransferase subunit GatA [Rhabdochlamydiaceae bacterium]|nr:Asp-tRNA(Asn)/Glu-tRNA(Gln) amidotransferase subunit GatA [Rhabdochlamydiaceae bacterium]